MKKILRITGNLEHDGDGVVRIFFEANSENFSGVTAVWGSENNISKLVSVLTGFPIYTPAEVSYSFGAPKSGQCNLRFATIDSVGHCAVWIQLVAEDEAHFKGGFEEALICLRVTSAALDEFCHQLRQFERGRKNEAILSEHAL